MRPDGTLKDAYDLLAEMADRWKEMSEVQKKKVEEDLVGTHHRK